MSDANGDGVVSLPHQCITDDIRQPAGVQHADDHASCLRQFRFLPRHGHVPGAARSGGELERTDGVSVSPSDAKQSRVERCRQQDGDGGRRRKDGVEVDWVEDSLVAAAMYGAVPHEDGATDGEVEGPETGQEVSGSVRWRHALRPRREDG